MSSSHPKDRDYAHFLKALNAYHNFTESVAVYPGAGESGPSELSYLSLGLAGETGETVDVIKKAIRRGYLVQEDQAKLEGELGDLLFYWTRLCYAAGLNPANVLQENVGKLSERKDSGTLKDR